ncbi:glycerol kinase [Blastocladiella britannica]|nr:glycerol kinase [Blastocladiella britannica]
MASPQTTSPVVRSTNTKSPAPSSTRRSSITDHATAAAVLVTTPPTDGKYVAAIDQGTTSSRFIVFDTTGRIVAVRQVEFDQIHPHAGWTEHDPQVILDSVTECMAAVVTAMRAAGLDPTRITSIGITNQRETTVAWDSATGQHLCNAIVWHDTRPQSIVDALVAATPTKSKDHYAKTTGLPLATYFSATKMRWMLDHVPAVSAAARDGTLRFGTVDAWLLYKLTGDARVHATDVTNASRTLLMDLRERAWSQEMLDLFGISRTWLPTIRPSSYTFGTVGKDLPLAGVPLSGCLGDQQAALVGQKCFAVGEAKNTYGTGCFMLLNTGSEMVPSTHGLLTTAAYDIPALGPPAYALEGSVAVGGASIKFLRDNLGLISATAEVNELAAQVSHTGGVYFVPAFSGLYAPYWRNDARGVLVGLTSYTDRRHICRAVLEAVAFQSLDVLDAMNRDCAVPLVSLKVDGGMTNSDLAMQLQADLAGIPVHRPAMRETTALGAAIAAALATGAMDVKDLDRVNADGADQFHAAVSSESRDRRRRKWAKAVARTLDWVDEDDAADAADDDQEVVVD